MPLAPRRACSTPGCPGYATHRSKCERCASAKNQRRETSTDRGYDVAWRRVRNLILRQEPLCRICHARGRYVPATDVDHIVPIRSDPSRRLDASNLQPLCKACHSRKTAMESSGWGDGGSNL